MTTSYLDNYYARLGVPKSADRDQIRAAYHKAARRLHPDASEDPRAVELFLQIQEAYETLADDKKRAAYNATLPPDIDPPADIMVNALYSRTVIPILEEPQLIYVLLDLMPSPREEEDQDAGNTPLNVSLILDTSTSMAGERMDMVKNTAIELVRQLSPQDVLSIVTFNDRASVLVPATKGLNYGSVTSRISLLQTGGGTEIFSGLQAGYREVASGVSPFHVNHLILVTDGRTYGDEDDCLQLAELASEKGVTISAMGIGSEWNDEFVDKLTSITGGTSVYASKPKDIQKFLHNKFNSLSDTYANEVNMEIQPGENVEMRYAFRLAPEPGPLPEIPTIPLGSLPRSASLSVIMEFVLNGMAEDAELVTLAQGNIQLEIPSRSIPSTAARFSFTRPAAQNPEFEPPPQVLVKAMSRLALYRMQEQARKDIEAGEVKKATERLYNLATQLLASGEADLAHTVRLKIKNIESGKALSGEEEKDLKYRTRSLLLQNDKKEFQR